MLNWIVLIFPNGLLRMDAPAFVDRQKFTFISSVPTLGAIQLTYLVQWPIGTDGEISEESVLSGRYDSDDGWNKRNNLVRYDNTNNNNYDNDNNTNGTN